MTEAAFAQTHGALLNPALRLIRGLRRRSPNVLNRASWAEENDNLCEEAANAPHTLKGATSALPGDQYAPTVRYWLFDVVKVLLLIYKTRRAQGQQKRTGTQPGMLVRPCLGLGAS